MYFGSVFLMGELDMLKRAAEGGGLFVNRHGHKYAKIRKAVKKMRRVGLIAITNRMTDGEIYAITEAGRDKIIHTEIKTLLKKTQ